MTIHTEHPFADADPDPVRRFRGRMGGRVSLWTTGGGQERCGLTVTSYLLANGRPPHVLGLVDPDSDLAEMTARIKTTAVQLLEWPHRDLAEAFAGTFPAPGGPFRLGEWHDTDWGPVLAGSSAWVGVRLDESKDVGWATLLHGVVEHIELLEEKAPLLHRRGRYFTVG